MEAYEEFTRDPCNLTNPSCPPTAASRRQASSPQRSGSAYPFAQGHVCAQRGSENVQAAQRDEDFRQLAGADVDVSMSERNYRTDFLGIMRPPECDFENKREYLNRCVNAYVDLMNQRPGEAPLESYGNSGQPFNLNDPSRGIECPPSQGASQTYDESGSGVEGPVCPRICTDARRAARRKRQTGGVGSGQPLRLSELASAESYGCDHLLSFPEFAAARSRSEGRAPEQYNRGRQLNFSDFERERSRSEDRATSRQEYNFLEFASGYNDGYDAAGRPINWSEFGRSGVKASTPLTRQSLERHNTHGGPLNQLCSNQINSQTFIVPNPPASLSDIGDNRAYTRNRSATNPIPESCNTSGGHLNQVFSNQINSQTFNNPSRSGNLPDIVGNRTYTINRCATSPIPERCNASGGPLNPSGSNQINSQTYIISNRPANLPDIGGNRTYTVNRSAACPILESNNASGGHSNLSRSNQINSDTFNVPSLPATLSDVGGNRAYPVHRPPTSPMPAFSPADRLSNNNRNCQAGQLAANLPLDVCGRIGPSAGANLGPSGFGNRCQAIMQPGEARGMCSAFSMPHSPGSNRAQQGTASGARRRNDAFIRSMRACGGCNPPIPEDDFPTVDCHKGTPECPRLPEDVLMDLLRHEDLKRGDIPRHPLFNVLVRDNYYPGTIDDAVNGKIDFNELAFKHTFGCKPVPEKIEFEDVPITLLEAFEERLVYEDELRETMERRREYCINKDAETGSLRRADEDTLDSYSDLEDQAKFWTHRDELKLASTIDIDLVTNYRDQPETGLTMALGCLFKAEKMHNYDKLVHIAEAAIQKKQRETPEKAAIKSSCSFHIDMHKEDKTKGKHSYNPIEIISYIGTTKPSDE